MTALAAAASAGRNLLGLLAGVGILATFLLIVSLARTGKLDQWPDRRTCAVLGAAAVVFFAGAVILWATLPIGWRWT